MFTNCQIFDNVVKSINYLGDHVSYEHTIYGSLTTFKPGWPFLFLGLIIIVGRIIDFMDFEKYFYSSDIKELLKKKPKSESFYQIISKSDKLWLLAEERFLKKQYGIHRLQKGVYGKIKTAKPG